MNRWDKKKLGEVCEFSNGQAHEKCIDESGKFKVINSKFISSEGEIYKRTNKALSPLFKNDIAMVMSDVPNGKTIAKCFLVDEDDTYTLNQRICVIRSKQFLPRFLYYQLNRNRYLLSFDNGENQTNLRKDDILNCDLLVPSLPEQKKIVSLLDEAFASIERAIENSEKNLQNAKDIFKSYLQSVFENKGDGWEEKRLIEIGTAQTGTTPKTIEKENYGDFIPFIKPADVDFLGVGDIRYDNEGLSKIGLKKGRKMEAGSILMVCIGATIGKVGFSEQMVSCNQQINSLTVKSDFEPKFFYHAMTTKQFQNRVLSEGKGAQATLPIINKTKWENLTIKYPISKKEQKAIVERLEKLSIETKKLETIYQQKLSNLQELKKSILQKAFSGELTSKQISEVA